MGGQGVERVRGLGLRTGSDIELLVGQTSPCTLFQSQSSHLVERRAVLNWMIFKESKRTQELRNAIH